MCARLLLYLIVLSLVTSSVTRRWGRGWRGRGRWGGGWGRRGSFGGRISRFGGFRSGYGTGSLSSGHSFRNSLIGGAMGAFGGMIAYDVTKRIFRPRNTPYHYGGRDYYWDEYRNPRDDYIICSISVDELKNLPQVNGHVRTVREVNRNELPVAELRNNDSDIKEAVAEKPFPRSTPNVTASSEKALENLQYSNGSKPQVIVWACQRDEEVCCGTECCPIESGLSPKTKKIVRVILIIVAFVIISFGFYCFFYFLCRSEAEMGPLDMGFEPYSPFYGPGHSPEPPMCPPCPYYDNPGFTPAYVQPASPPPHPPSSDYPGMADYPRHKSRSDAPRGRPNKTMDLQRRSRERSENIQGKREEKSDADISPKRVDKNRKEKDQEKEKKESK